MPRFTDFFEPEEIVGGLWHQMMADVGRETSFEDAAVHLEAYRNSLGILYRGLGGKRGIELKPIGRQPAAYRKSFLARITHGSDQVTQARCDGDTLFLPITIDMFAQKTANADLYKWLTVWAASTTEQWPEPVLDPLQNDIAFIRCAHRVSQKVLAQYPGIKSIYDDLLPQFLAARPTRTLPRQEAEIEATILALLGNRQTHGAIWDAMCGSDQTLHSLVAAKGYKTFLPVVFWGQVDRQRLVKPGQSKAPDAGASLATESENEKTLKARRRKSDQVEKKSSLLLNRFETILSWSEMMNIPRAIEDDDEDHAKKAANDQEELGLVNIAKKASTKLKFDLDLAPEDVVHEQLAAKHTYPEWDYRKNLYYRDHCRVLVGPAQQMEPGQFWQPDKASKRRILAVKRQFEALRPKAERLHRQIDGNELDMDAIIRARCDFLANGESSTHVFSDYRQKARDLSVSVLVDISRSSESWIEGRQVIEISKEALMALALGLAACGDDNAIYSFSSLKRDRVMVSTLKGFSETLGPAVFSRIGALKPGFYTRLGAAIRHVSKELSATQSTKRLLLVLTDGKPNDLDHYEGRYGVEDTARAVREARRLGHAVFGITIDKKAQSYFPYIFGRNAFSIINHANDLIRALPVMYRQLVT
ncbi:MAG: protein norD [Robiginitomaculum sp.]|nr:MAG: protein norD [Robiginitomaculum sp.]